MSNLAVHNPITMWETISGNTELTQNPPQQSGQTFKVGSPLELAVALPPVPGNPQVAQVWDGTLGSLIYGVALEAVETLPRRVKATLPTSASRDRHGQLFPSALRRISPTRSSFPTEPRLLPAAC